MFHISSPPISSLRIRSMQWQLLRQWREHLRYCYFINCCLKNLNLLYWFALKYYWLVCLILPIRRFGGNLMWIFCHIIIVLFLLSWARWWNFGNMCKRVSSILFYLSSSFVILYWPIISKIRSHSALIVFSAIVN